MRPRFHDRELSLFDVLLMSIALARTRPGALGLALASR